MEMKKDKKRGKRERDKKEKKSEVKRSKTGLAVGAKQPFLPFSPSLSLFIFLTLDFLSLYLLPLRCWGDDVSGGVAACARQP